MHRALRFVALALTSCGAILGLEEPEFVAGGGDAANVPNEAGALDVTSDAASDVNTSDVTTLPSSRLREITFEEGAAVGGLHGASFAASTTIRSPGLRGSFAAVTGGKASYIRYDAPTPQKELFITFRWRNTLFNIADKGTSPQIMRVFRANGQPALELVADANEKLVMRVSPSQLSVNLLLGPGTDLRIGLHILAGAQGVVELYSEQIGSNGFGAPNGKVMASIDPIAGFDLGSGTALGPTPFSEVLLDDVIIDTEKLVAY